MRVGCSERIALKQVYYQGWNRSPAQVGCMTQWPFKRQSIQITFLLQSFGDFPSPQDVSVTSPFILLLLDLSQVTGSLCGRYPPTRGISEIPRGNFGCQGNWVRCVTGMGGWRSEMLDILVERKIISRLWQLLNVSLKIHEGAFCL